jgi:SAM-dependent methyltransferase
MLNVLKSKSEITAARITLQQRGLSTLEGFLGKALRRIGLNSSLSVGDQVKSWDVLKTIAFIESKLPKEAATLDLGSFCSEVPVALARLGYKKVHGIDLNPKISLMPFAGSKVKYDVGNFLAAPYPDASFDAITAISVIEHGYEPQRLFAEISRLLKPGGCFIASFDYWPEKVDTGDTKFFDMSWLIFSEADVLELISVAKEYNLHPVGSLEPEAGERTVECMGYAYSFGWVVLRKA